MRGLANTKMAGVYVFGGNYADNKPLPAGGPDPLRPPSGDHQVEISEGRLVTTNHAAQEIFVDSGVVDAFDRLATALNTNDKDEIGQSLTDLTQAFDRVQDMTGELGARMNQLDVPPALLETTLC